MLVESKKQCMYFLKFKGSRKFIPAKFVNQAIRESQSLRNSILKVGVRESLYTRKFLPAKLCTNKVVCFSRARFRMLTMIECASPVFATPDFIRMRDVLIRRGTVIAHVINIDNNKKY